MTLWIWSSLICCVGSTDKVSCVNYSIVLKNLLAFRFELSVILIAIIFLGFLFYNKTQTITQVTKAFIIDKYHDSGECYAVGDSSDSYSYYCDAASWGLVLKTDKGRVLTKNVYESFWKNTPINTQVDYCVTIGRLNIVVNRRVCM